MKKVAKNNVFVFEDITAPQFFFSDYSEDKTAARKKIFAFRPMTMETRCFHKKLEFPKIPAKRFLYRSLWAQIFNQKNFFFNFSKKPEKNDSWADLGPRSAWDKLSQMFVRILGQDRREKNSAKCLFEAARFRVLDRHRSTKPTTAPWNLNGVRPLGAPTHPLVTVSAKRLVIRRDLVRCLVLKLCQKIRLYGNL